MTKEKENLRIIWHGHSCFELKSDDAQIVIDPYEDVPGYPDLDLEADVVIASHDHFDHNAFDKVKLSGKKANYGLEIIQSFHDPESGKLRGQNKIHVITIAGYRVAHLGDLGTELSKAQAEMLAELDLLLIPVGGHFTIDAKQAADIVKSLKPKHCVPMHYREGEIDFDKLSTVDSFLQQFAEDEIENLESSDFDLSKQEKTILVLRNPV